MVGGVSSTLWLTMGSREMSVFGECALPGTFSNSTVKVWNSGQCGWNIYQAPQGERNPVKDDTNQAGQSLLRHG